MWHMTPEQAEAHNRAVSAARVIRREENETDRECEVRLRGKKVKKPRKPPVIHMREADVLKACCEVLERHPRVSFWWRQNTGGGRLTGGIFVKFSFIGASDLMAVSKTGQFIAVECKATNKKATPEQAAFLANVNAAGGLGVCIDHPGKLVLALEAL